AEALREAIGQVGGALVASAGTVIVGLGMLFFSSFAKIKYTGPAIALSLAVALAASLTLAPALLALLRKAIFWTPAPALLALFPRVRSRPERELRAPREAPPPPPLDDVTESGFWLHAADMIVRHPASILSVCLVALLPLAVVGARTRPNYNQLADLDPDR